MNPPRRNLTPSQAAAHLDISVKALRIYERHGLVAPDRTAAGWRVYTPDDLRRVADVVSLRTLGLSLVQIGRALRGDPGGLKDGLAAHEAKLKRQARQIAVTLEKVRSLRDGVLRGQAPTMTGLSAALERNTSMVVGFELPWPWGGEWFELRDVRPLNFITGPLGSGKTRFAKRLAEALPDAAFLGLDRLADGTIPHRLAEDTDLARRVERTLTWLTEDGAERSDALLALVVALESCTSTFLVVDMVEQGLGGSAQEAVISYLRTRTGQLPTLFLMTRSSVILDLETVGRDETVIVCPANHSPPFRMATNPGGRGHEAVVTCLAPPEVRARTAGVVAIRGDAAV